MGKPITYAFFRKNCKTCEKALAHLESMNIGLPSNAEDARKVRKSQDEMVALARQHKKVISIKGSKGWSASSKRTIQPRQLFWASFPDLPAIYALQPSLLEKRF